MHRTTIVRSLGVILFFAMLPAFSAAQDAFKCESNDGGRKYCGNYQNGQVWLDQQISGSPCIEGQGWGVDSRGLWVDRGCRAYFKARKGGGNWNGGGGGWNGGGGGGDTIKCESNDGGRKYCGNYNYNQVRMANQISGSPCTQGQTWGVDSRGLWVDRGCRANFIVNGGGWNGGGGGWNGGGGDTIKCESNDGGRKYCGNYNYNQVRMANQISGSPCIQGQTWGVDSRGLWVDRGCRANFSVNGGGGGGWNGGGNQNSIKCESNDGGRKYCGNYNSRQVRFDRQISGSPCDQGRGWGVDSRGLWVDRGCRAYFIIR